MNRFFLTFAIGLCLAARLPAQQPVVITVEVPVKTVATGPALKYTLLPAAEDLTPGNAATRWRQAAQAFRDSGIKITEQKEEKWLSPTDTPLKEFPRQEVRDFLDKARQALRLADEAARRSYCDWEYPPLTFQNIEALPVGEYQAFREFTRLLPIRFRLELAEGKFDAALKTLQTGLALGRHVGEGPTIIQSLVGMALTGIMLGKVEEFMEQPGAPNLYWALTALPRPFIDLRKPLEHELGVFQRSFPQVRDLDKERLTPEQAQKLVEEVFEVWVKLHLQNEDSGLQDKLRAALTVPALHAEAKKYLIDKGRKATEVDAMSPAQVVLLWFVDRKGRGRSDSLALFALPPWQTVKILEDQNKVHKQALTTAAILPEMSGSLALEVMTSPLLKFYMTSVRTERWIAGLRTVEAVRLHAAASEGKLPKVLKDVKVVPQAIDPHTGGGFEEFYSTAGDGAVLSVPQFSSLVRRYIVSPVR